MHRFKSFGLLKLALIVVIMICSFVSGNNAIKLACYHCDSPWSCEHLTKQYCPDNDHDCFTESKENGEVIQRGCGSKDKEIYPIPIHYKTCRTHLCNGEDKKSNSKRIRLDLNFGLLSGLLLFWNFALVSHWHQHWVQLQPE